MKFAIRCSTNPVIMRFDGRVIAREVGDPTLIHLVSVCGIDFASRVHDHVDLTHYIKNWKEVYIFDAPWRQDWDGEHWKPVGICMAFSQNIKKRSRRKAIPA